MVNREEEITDDLPLERASIDFVVLGDFAQAIGGKLTVVGIGWTLVNAVQYPVQFPFGLGIGILIPWNETNRRHRIEFKITGEGAVQLASGTGEVEAGRQPGLPLGMTQRAMVGISGQLALTGPGTYQVEVTMEGSRKVLSFQALPATGQPGVAG